MSGTKRSAEEAGLEAGPEQKRTRTAAEITTELEGLAVRKNELEWERFEHADTAELRRANAGKLMAQLLMDADAEEKQFLDEFARIYDLEVTLERWEASGYSEASRAVLRWADERLKVEVLAMVLPDRDEDQWKIAVENEIDTVVWEQSNDEEDWYEDQLALLAGPAPCDAELAKRFLRILARLQYSFGLHGEREALLHEFPEARVPSGQRPLSLVRDE